MFTTGQKLGWGIFILFPKFNSYFPLESIHKTSISEDTLVWAPGKRRVGCLSSPRGMASPAPDSLKQHRHSLRTQAPSTALRTFADVISFKSCNDPTRYCCHPTFTMRKLNFKMVKLCAWAHTPACSRPVVSVQKTSDRHRSPAVQPPHHAASHSAHAWERRPTQPPPPSSFYRFIYPFTFVCLYLSYIYIFAFIIVTFISYFSYLHIFLFLEVFNSKRLTPLKLTI